MKCFSCFIAIVLFVVTSFSNTINLNQKSLNAADGLSVSRSTRSGISLSYNLSRFNASDVTVRGNKYSTITIEGVILPNDEGKPDLPVYSRFVVIPNGATPVLTIRRSNSEQISGITVAPAPSIPRDSDDSPVQYPINHGIYSSNSLYPKQIVTVSKPFSIRGFTVAAVSISPFQYNPVTKELKAYSNIEFDISFQGGNSFGDNRLRSKWWDPIVKGSIINTTVITPCSYDRDYTKRQTDGCDYLIISADHEEFIEQAERIKAFRNAQGILTKLVTVSDIGANDADVIEAYINDAYNNWNPAPSGVLMVGDYGIDNRSVTMPFAEGYCISDNVYADVDSDGLPEMIFARMVANTKEQLQNIVDKVINFENNPVTDASYYNTPVIAVGWQTERWFQVFGEVTYQFMTKKLGKSAIREYAIYEGDPQAGTWSTSSNTQTILEYFGPSGLNYLPASPTYLTDINGTSARITQDINSGSFLVIHRDHGGVTGWGEPSYRVNDVETLTNSQLPVVFSINCLTGKFNESYECFAEAFIRHPQGAVGILAATETSWSWVNDTYGWGMIDHIWQDFMPDYPTGTVDAVPAMPAFSSVYGKIFLAGSSWPSNANKKAVTYALFHYHGDAFTTMHTKVPSSISLSCNNSVASDAGSFSVTAASGASVALSHRGELIGVKESNGSAMSFTIPELGPGYDLVVTATKIDSKRTVKNVSVTAGSLGYMDLISASVNDGIGNNNGVADYSEEIELSMNCKNIGGGNLDNVSVKISTKDPNFSISTDNLSFGAISGGQALTNKGFRIKINENVPDEYSGQFDAVISDGTGKTWSGTFRITAYAPILVVDKIFISQTSGNSNGLVEKGEKFAVSIDMRNNGHSDSRSATGNLTASNKETAISGSNAVGVLSKGSSKTVSYELSINNNFDKDSGLVLHYSLDADIHSAKNYQALPVHKITENFESGNFSNLNWKFTGHADWQVVQSVTNTNGSYCAKSGNLTHHKVSGLTVEMEFPTAGEVRFKYVASCQWWRDYLSFHIDGNPADYDMQGWSGTTYDQCIVPVPEGRHILEWRYRKDDETTENNDCVYLDDIEFIFGAGMVSKARFEPQYTFIGEKVSATEIKNVGVNIKNTGTEDIVIKSKLISFDANGNPEQMPTLNLTEKFSYPIGTPRTGVVFLNGSLYFSQWSDGKLEKWDLSGNVTDNFTIAGISSMRSITTDGTFLYAVNRLRGIYKVDLNQKKVIDQYVTPNELLIDPNGIAYDAGADGFWVDGYSDASNGPVMLDRDMRFVGGTTGMVHTHYDVAFDNFTPAGPYIWIVERQDQPDETKFSYLKQYDINNQEYTNTSFLLDNQDNGPGGIFVTDQITDGKVTVVAVTQGGTVKGFDICESNIMRIDKNRICTIEPGKTKRIEIRVDGKKLNGKLKKGMLTVSAGAWRQCIDIPVEINGTVSIDNKATVIGPLALFGTFPNPVRNQAVISFNVPKTMKVTLSLFNVKGKLIKTVVDGKVKAGRHAVNISANELASGIYYYRLSTAKKVLSKKMLIVK